MNQFSVAAGLSLLLVSSPLALAADAGGNYAVWGIGQASCNQFVTAYDADKLTDYKNYLSGYLTAFNTVADGVYQATKANSLTDNLKLLHEHCGTHRLDSFERAIQALLTATAEQPAQAEEDPTNHWGRPPAPR